MILSLGPKLRMQTAKVGDELKLVMETRPNLAGVKTAIGAGQSLVRGWQDAQSWPSQSATAPTVNHRLEQQIPVLHRRGRSPEGPLDWDDLSRDGRVGEGIRFAEAVEFDGGGSSTLWATGKILNSPSDGRPRAIANGLILLRAN